VALDPTGAALAFGDNLVFVLEDGGCLPEGLDGGGLCRKWAKCVRSVKEYLESNQGVKRRLNPLILMVAGAGFVEARTDLKIQRAV
jgi:hypothetical protein